MHKKTPKALIIGISGQDGGYLARLLLQKGYEVHGTSRDHETCLFSNLIKLGVKSQIHLHSLVTGDFRSVLTILQKVRADEIYNLAGQTSVGLSFAYPVETFDSILIGTMNLLECLRLLRHPGKFYNAGSSEVFGNTIKPAVEHTSYYPRSPYAAAKAAANYAVTNYRDAYGLYACTGILFNHESPLRSERFVTKKIISAAVQIANGSKEVLKLGRLDIIRDWGWAPEYVEAMWLMLQASKPDDYVIATGKSHSLKEFVEETFSSLGLNWKKHVIVDKNLYRPADIKISQGNATKARIKLKWKARTQFKQIIQNLLHNCEN